MRRKPRGAVPMDRTLPLLRVKVDADGRLGDLPLARAKRSDQRRGPGHIRVDQCADLL
jgi:hypothetical protein